MSLCRRTAFNLAIAVLIFVSVTLTFAEFLLPESDFLTRVAETNELLTWVFVVELFLRYFVAPNKVKFFSNFWIDILTVIPVLRVFRTFRLLRLMRLLRLVRVGLIIMRQSGLISQNTQRSAATFMLLILTTVRRRICPAREPRS